MPNEKPDIIDLLRQKQWHEQEIEKINQYIEVEWPAELKRSAQKFAEHIEEIGDGDK